MMPHAGDVLIAIGGHAMLAVLFKATITTALALVAVAIARRSRAAVRHTLLLAAFAVLLALPIAAAVAPAMTIAVPVAAPAVGATDRTFGPLTEQGSAVTALESSATAPDTAPVRWTPPSLSSILLVVWGAGVVLCLVPVFVGLAQVRSLRRAGLPWIGLRGLLAPIVPAALRRRVAIVLHEDVPGPMTCGVFRHTIVLPRDAESWPTDDLERALVHEFEHVRRRDWLSQCMARTLCAAYWFHPLVWIAWRRFALEAERACDDAVLRRADAAQYAEQLVALARRLSVAGKAPALAMANRRDLATRVTAVLDDRQPRGRAGAGVMLSACLASVALIVAVSPLRIVAADRAERPANDAVSSTQQPMPVQRFEAVSIRPCVDNTPPPGANGGARSGQGGFPTISPGRFTIDCGTVERLISNAYVLNGERLTNNNARIGDVSWWKGGPEWIRYDKFTIEASAPGVTDRGILLGPMLRALLEDRFKLKLHRETQDAPMYAMTIAKGGLKIQPMPPGGCSDYRDQVFDAETARANAAAVNAGTAKPTCDGMTMMGGPGHARWTIGGTTLPHFAGILTTSMDHYVIDKTGYDPETKFNIHLEFAPDEHVPGADKRNPRTTFDPPDAPTIFAALEQQLGLKLEATKGPQGVLVIDHVERPMPDGPWTTWTAPLRATGPGSRPR